MVSPELFPQAQRILDERERHSIKQYRHQDYLADSCPAGGAAPA
jgi:hypothetical protein